MKASVVIPVKNGGLLLQQVLTAVLEQHTPWPFEVLVIDSGSQDGSREYVAQLDTVRLHTIHPKEFGHGRTRNLGAELTTGEFIVFLTQDALPTDRYWLARLVHAADLAPDTAGAFGRHIAYAHSSPVTAKELAAHFLGFGDQTNLVRLEDKNRYQHDQGYRQYLHFFSSNNACIRRTVWQRIPLPDVEFAEDQLWAKTAIEAGYSKAYAIDACVFHSHDFGLFEGYRRAFDEARALRRLFGYELVPTLTHLGKHYLLQTRRDWLWIISERLDKGQKLVWLLKIPWLNLARLIGFYMGSNQDKLPVWLHYFSSRDKALQRS